MTNSSLLRALINLSIISSIIGSELIDNMIDKILFYKPIENLVEKSSLFLVLIITYFFV